MSCLSPTPTDADLLAYLDGDTSLAEHIAQCPSCQARVRKLATEEQALALTLARIDCPDALELGEYALGLVSEAKREEIALHLAHCPECARELKTLQTFLKSSSVEKSFVALQDLGKNVRVLIAKLLQDARTSMQRPGGLTPAMAGIRGVERAPLIYDAQEYQLAIQFQEDAGKPGRRALYGLLIGDEPDAFEVQLWRENTLVAHTAVDAYGNFSISGLQPGDYDMKLVRPQLAIQLDDLGV